MGYFYMPYLCLKLGTLNRLRYFVLIANLLQNRILIPILQKQELRQICNLPKIM